MNQCRLLLTRASIAPLLQTTWHLSLHYFISETNEDPLAISAFLIQKAIGRHKMYALPEGECPAPGARGFLVSFSADTAPNPTRIG